VVLGGSEATASASHSGHALDEDDDMAIDWKDSGGEEEDEEKELTTQATSTDSLKCPVYFASYNSKKKTSRFRGKRNSKARIEECSWWI